MTDVLGGGRMGFKIVNLVLILSILTLFLGSALALFDMSEGRFALDMDQRISYDGLFSLYHSSSFREFVYNFTTGFDQDLRYGRGFWNITSVAVFPFFVIFGVPGQIVATRIFGLFVMTISYFLFARISIKNRTFQLLTVITLMLLTTHIHYIANPKPEPLLLLFLSIFLTIYSKQKFQFGWSYLILGIAWGLKVSIAPLVLIFVILSIWVTYLSRNSIVELIQRVALSAAYFLFGWVVCSPVLFVGLWPLIATMFALAMIAHSFLSKKKNQYRKTRLLESVLGISTIALFVFLYFGSKIGHDFSLSLVNPVKEKIKFWLATVSGESHLGGVNFESIASWVSLINQEFFSGFGFIILITFGLTLYWSCQELIAQKFTGCNSPYLCNSILLVILGTVSLVSVLSSVTRLWDFYLHLGLVLLIVGIVGVLSTKIEFNGISDEGEKSLFNNRNIAFLCITAFFAVSILPNIPKATKELVELSSRTSNESYIVSMEDHDFLNNLFERQFELSGNTIRVAYDPPLFIPDASEKLAISPIWSEFQDWSSNFDYIVFSESRLPWLEDMSNIPDGFAKHIVAEDKTTCKEQPCYVIGPYLPSGGVVFTKTD